jgi:hypothetical protein
VVQLYGAHLLKQARENNGATADAAAPDFTPTVRSGVLF